MTYSETDPVPATATRQEDAVRAEAVRILYTQGRRLMLLNPLGAVFVGVLFMDPAPHGPLAAWIVAMCVLVGVRALHAARVVRHARWRHQRDRLLATYLAGSAATGLLWGLGYLWLAPAMPFSYQVMLLMTLCVVGATATPSLSPVRLGYPLYVLPLALPPTLWNLAAGRPENVTLALITILLFSANALVFLRTSAGELERLRAAVGKDRLIGTLRDANLALEERSAEARRDSLIDPLTGIANRRAFDEALQTEWLRARRSGQPLSLIVFDLDFFKRFNDRYGHPAGDDCLRLVAGAARGACRRATDLLARYGGEEFAVVLPDTDREGARRVAEDVRQRISGCNLPHAASPHGHVTISAGFASMRPDFSSLAADLVDLADEALYRAKNSGRNRIVGFDDPPPAKGKGERSAPDAPSLS